MIRVLIFGAGRMAHSLLSVASEFPDIEVVGVIFHDPAEQGGDAQTIFFESLDSAQRSLDESIDLVIDFSLAEGTVIAADWCRQKGIALLSGVTGITQTTHAELDAAAENAAVLWAPNLSLGVNLLAGLIREVAPVLDGKAKVSIEETHHVGKKDAPSGTALFLAEQFGAVGDIEMHSIREGDEVGEHAVTIQLADEVLTLTHKAQDRRLFARGALEAGQWLVKQDPGRYTAADWISGMISAQFPHVNGQA